MTRLHALTLVGFLFAAAPTSTRADAGVPDAGVPDASAGTDGAAGPRITPPELRDFVEAAFPEAARAAGLTAEVELELTIAADGSVSDAAVVAPVGNGFDEAAVDAARRFRFEPARVDGQAVPVRIRYRYVFEQRPAEVTVPEVPPPPPTGVLEGRVLRQRGDAPLSSQEVIVVSADGVTSLRAMTDDEGRFSVEGLAPGTYRVSVLVEGLEPFDAEEAIAAGEATAVIYRVAGEEEDTEGFGAVARIDPPPREVTRRSIRREELTRVAGTRGDALRTVELLPGVARPPFGAGFLVVRGSAPQDSRSYLDGINVPILYHFGGITSFFSSRLLEQIDFYPGNFSARYGRGAGGVVEIGVRDPATDGLHGMLDTNLIDTSFLLEGPINDELSVAIAGRRSYIDFFFESVVPADAFDVVAAPVYYDYQAIGVWKPTERDRVRLMAYGSSDTFNVIFSDPAEQDPNVRGDLDLFTGFHRAQLGWRRQLTPWLDQDIELMFGSFELRFGLGNAISFSLDGTQFFGRSEWRARPNSSLRLTAGMDIAVAPIAITYRGPQPQQTEGNTQQDPLGTVPQVVFSEDVNVYQPAAYAEIDYQPIERLNLIAGVRLDYYKEIQAWSFDPRLAARYALDEHWTLKGGVGVFSQPPQFQESANGIGNPGLDPIRSLHVGAGFDHRFDDTISLGVEGFYKHLWDRVVAVPGGLGERFINDGIGRIYGLEIAGRIEPRGRLFGFLSYTLSRSERRDRDEAWRLFDYDQTHIFTVAATYRLGRGWELGGTLRLVSGNPYTPVIGSIYNVNADLYQPLYASVNSERAEFFHRLDVRIEKLWRFQHWRLAVYLDVQNAYNSMPSEGEVYNYDYTQRSDIPGLPIIPSLGLRGEL